MRKKNTPRRARQVSGQGAGLHRLPYTQTPGSGRDAHSRCIQTSLWTSGECAVPHLDARRCGAQRVAGHRSDADGLVRSLGGEFCGQSHAGQRNGSRGMDQGAVYRDAPHREESGPIRGTPDVATDALGKFPARAAGRGECRDRCPLGVPAKPSAGQESGARSAAARERAIGLKTVIHSRHRPPEVSQTCPFSQSHWTNGMLECPIECPSLTSPSMCDIQMGRLYAMACGRRRS